MSNRLGLRVRHVLALAAVVGMLIAGCTPGAATTAVPEPSPSARGETPSAAALVTATPLAQGSSEDRLAEARSIVERFGFPAPTGGSVVSTTDPDTGIPQTTARLDGWIVAWDAQEMPATVFRSTPWVTPPPLPLARSEILDRAVTIARSIGAVPGSSPELSYSGDLWAAFWPMVVDGVPGLHDGIGVTLNADGSFLGFHRLWRPVEPKPAQVLTREQAIAALQTRQRNAAPSAVPLRIVDATLVWAEPTGQRPAATLRLCWEIVTETGDDLGYPPRGRSFLDAGTGRLLWSDSTA